MKDQTKGSNDSYFDDQGRHGRSAHPSPGLPSALDAVLGSSFRPISIALTVGFLGFAIVHALVLPPPVARIMVPAAAAMALLGFGG